MEQLKLNKLKLFVSSSEHLDQMVMEHPLPEREKV